MGSGCAALIYEVVWFQLLQLVIGSSSISLGILLGNWQVRRAAEKTALQARLAAVRGQVSDIRPFRYKMLGQFAAIGLKPGLAQFDPARERRSGIAGRSGRAPSRDPHASCPA